MDRIFIISTILFSAGLVYFLNFRRYIKLKNSLDLFVCVVTLLSLFVMFYYAYVGVITNQKEKKSKEEVLGKSIIFFFLASIVSFFPFLVIIKLFMIYLPKILNFGINDLSIMLVSVVISYCIVGFILSHFKILSRLLNWINNL